MPKSLKLPGYPDLYNLESRKGHASDSLISPLFEYSREYSESAALMIIIYSIFYTVFASLGLIKGVSAETRIYYFPWLILTLIEIVVIFHRGFSLIYKYSYDPGTLLIATMINMFGVYHTYLYIVVLSNYKYLKRIQNPTLIFPPDL